MFSVKRLVGVAIGVIFFMIWSAIKDRREEAADARLSKQEREAIRREIENSSTKYRGTHFVVVDRPDGKKGVVLVENKIKDR